jgi:hypothetical protein
MGSNSHLIDEPGRRRILKALTLAGTASVLGTSSLGAAEVKPETTRIRIPQVLPSVLLPSMSPKSY